MNCSLSRLAVPLPMAMAVTPYFFTKPLISRAAAALAASLPGRVKVAHAGIQHLAVFIHHGQLAAGAEAGVHAQGHLALDGRLHQQLVQVLGEDLDGLHVGPVGQLIADLPLQGGEQQPVPGVLAGHRHLL